MDTFELRSSLAGYLKTSVANRARDYRRKKRPQTVAVNDAEQRASDDNGPVHLVMRSELSQQLGSAMSRLPYEQRPARANEVQGHRRIAESVNQDGPHPVSSRTGQVEVITKR